MHEELLANCGRRNWQIEADTVNAGGYVMYDDRNCIRAIVGQDNDYSWYVRVIFLERMRTYYDFATSAAALERALDLLRWEAAKMIPAILRRLAHRPPDPLLAWAIAQAMNKCERGHPWSPDIGPATCPDCWAEDRNA